MDKLANILLDLEQGKISSDYAEELVLRLFSNYTPMQLGEDMDGLPIYPNDDVLIEGDSKFPLKIKHGKYRELFGEGYVVGWYVPDYCKKIV